MLINLLDSKISYIIVESNTFNFEKLNSILYSKDFTLFNISKFSNGKYIKSLLALSNYDNNDLRKESIFILEEFNMNSIYVKYKNETYISTIDKLGREHINDLKYYDNDLTKDQFIFEGISFTINKKDRYYFPKQKSDLKNDLIVEIYNNNNWIEKQIFNIDIEYDRMYKLLIKYEKIRIKINN